MTLNERILDFLDGSLPAEAEAELLHTLSVSPEKRGVLRDFMEQRALFERDSKTLSVPYEAEQRLWARIDGLTPAESPAESPLLVPVEMPESGFFANTVRGARTMVSATILFAGIGIGYFAGAHNAPTHTHVVRIYSALPATGIPAAQDISAAYLGTALHRTPRILDRRLSTTPEIAAPTLPALPTAIPAPTSLPSSDPKDRPDAPVIAQIAARPLPAIAMNDIGGDGGGIKPMFHQIRPERAASPLFLSRFEFRFDESFGRQFPNNAATNVSLPLITNTSVSAFFQVLPHSNLLWAGAGYGTANITRKNLYTQTGDPFDPSQQVLAADTSHAQTSYIAGIAELRLPAFATTDLTFDAGYGYASLGRMMFGEVGLHYNISEQVGTQFGLRVVQFSYDLSAEKAAAIQSGSGGLAISNAVASAGPSFNTELNAGLFFHF